MFTLGITGPSGAGKSIVSQRLCSFGFSYVNADMAARSVVEKGKPCLNKLAKAFSGQILRTDGTLDRAVLAKLAFAGNKVELLNKTIFPFIINELIERLALFEKEGCRYAVLDAPTLFESKADLLCSKVLFVTADRELRLKRIIERDGLCESAAKERIGVQHDDSFYRSRADYVIINNGGSEELRMETDRIADEIIKLYENK